MNAYVERSGWTDPDARRALAVLGAAAGPLGRWGSTAIYLLFLVGGIVVWQIARTPEKGAHGIVMLGAIGAVPLWASWFSRVLAVQAAGRSLRMPRTDSDTWWALGFAAVVTLLLPAALATFAGVDARIAYGGMLTAGAAGMLVMLLPGALMAGGIAGFGWLVILGAAVPQEWWPQAWLSQGSVSLDPLFVARQLPWLAMVLAALVAWRWRTLLDVAGRAERKPGRAAVLDFAHADAGTRDESDLTRQLPDWMWPAGQIEPAGPARPARAMGAWLGTPFAPLSRGQAAVQWALAGVVVLVLCVVVFGNVDVHPFAALVFGCGLAGGLLGTVGSYGQRLVVVRRPRSAEWSELALLPGWGDAAAARTILLRTVLTPISQLAAGLVVLLLVALIPGGFGAGDVLLVALSTVAVWLAAFVGCLWPLSGRQPGGVQATVLYLVGVVLPVASTLAATTDLEQWLGAGAGIGGTLAWVFALAWLLACSRAGWRRFHAQPHPFLQE